jgi:hypothetical protein
MERTLFLKTVFITATIFILGFLSVTLNPSFRSYSDDSNAAYDRFGIAVEEHTDITISDQTYLAQE